MGRVDGKIAFVTGVARGQGRSHAIRLAEEGADIFGVDLCEDIATNGYPLATEADLKETARLVESIGRRAVLRRADVRELTQLRSAAAEAIEHFGHIDVVVANAGICPLGDQPPTAFTDAVDVCLSGVINTVSALLPHLQDGASIVATGSAAAFSYNSVGSPTAGPGGAGYAFAKRIVASYAHDLAYQLASRSIRVNVVHPTNCNTDMLHSQPMYDVFRPDLEHPTREETHEAFKSTQLMPVPYIEPEDVSDAVLFLASDESRYVTGTQVHVNAGAFVKLGPYRYP